MRRAAAALLAVVVIASAMAAESGAALPAPVAQALKSAYIDARNVAVIVRSVDGGTPVISHNPAQAMNPASVMKLLTTYAALEILGPSYTWTTEALVEAAPVDGLLAGNLTLRGSGDPKLGLEQFWLLLRELRWRGVRDIGGDLVIDRSAFALPPHDAAAFDQEPLRPYNAGPDALLVNFKAIRFVIAPDPERRAVRVWQESPDARLRIDNRLSLGNGDCGDWRELLTPRFDGLTLQLTGSFAATCGEKALNLSPFAADVQVDGLFRGLWGELGGTLRGQVREGVAAAGATVFVSRQSPALAEIVRDTNKFSNNVMARQILLGLAPERPATPAAAERRVRQWLTEKNLRMPELVLENGAGLSRRERISADSLAALLAAAWASPVMAEFVASLPVSGSDGTLKKRLNGGPASGRAHLKTGYLDSVRSLAGYVLDAHGKRWIVVALINDPNARAGKPALDALVDGVAGR